MRKSSLYIFLCFATLISAVAQPSLTDPLPIDPRVKIGKLSNGLTYYIQKNTRPEKKVELRLVVNTGSILEDDDQRGLAHFTEHMAFNGSKNFEKNDLISFLQSIGVKFGADLNAYTSFDETVYILPIPTEKKENVDKGFQILEDWASTVAFDHAEIDKERGVVLVQLSDIIVMARDQQSINTLTPIDIKLRPTNDSQDILRMVPGLFIAQHAGGGKAEQIFLRGFDIDHGTDLNLEVDGLPVNMVSHAHGQGYADLHFVIPELINYVDFDKGPYFANKGDFTTAGYVDFQTKNALEENFVKLEGGQFGTLRAVAGINLFPTKNSRTYGYVGSEAFLTDGFVDSPQNFNRFNVTSKITTRLKNEDNLSIGVSYFRSKWDASGQIPNRAVESGLVTRFGSIDNTEGGETSRANLFLKHTHRFSNGAYLSQQAYGIHYKFNLYSNFTFYLNNPVDGDQIQQEESRAIYGYKASYNRVGQVLGKDLTTYAGIGVRLDRIDDVALSHTAKRQFLEDIQRGNINEANFNAYISETLSLSEKWSVNTALRFDYFNFNYKNSLIQIRRSAGKGIISPKVNVNYQVNSKTLLYFRTGLGFHSNDARVVTEQRGKEILPRAYGVDLGVNMKATDRLFLNAALWRLDLDQEFVYVGDEGIIEPSGRTRRMGIDFSVRYEILPWLFLDGDLNLTKPNAKDEPEKENYIPLAPTVSSIGGLSFNMKNGLNGTLRYRYIGNRAANENNSVIAKGYVIADAVLNYTRPKYEFGISIENLFDTEWNEAQFDTESRLIGEKDPVSEIHFTPGTPLFFKLRASFFF